ncbi:hypothetical protein pb186bvf_013545 [Paramecium bursaria]
MNIQLKLEVFDEKCLLFEQSDFPLTHLKPHHLLLCQYSLYLIKKFELKFAIPEINYKHNCQFRESDQLKQSQFLTNFNHPICLKTLFRHEKLAFELNYPFSRNIINFRNQRYSLDRSGLRFQFD